MGLKQVLALMRRTLGRYQVGIEVLGIGLGVTLVLT